MKKYLGISGLLAAWLFASPAAAAEISPDTLVDNTAQEVLSIVRQDKELRAGNMAKILIWSRPRFCRISTSPV